MLRQKKYSPAFPDDTKKIWCFFTKFLGLFRDPIDFNNRDSYKM